MASPTHSSLDCAQYQPLIGVYIYFWYMCTHVIKPEERFLTFLQIFAFDL